MPIIKSAIKRMKQTTVRRARNVETKKSVKTAVKAFLEKPSFKALSAAQSELDTAVKKRVLNPRTAARRKANLVKISKEAGVKFEKTSTPKAKTTKPAAKTTSKTATKAAPVKRTVAKKK